MRAPIVASFLFCGCQFAQPATASVARSPDAALAFLAQFGDVAACRPTRAWHPKQPGEFFDREVASPVPPLERLAGKTSQIAPYLASDQVRVVHRAVDLLCSIQDDDAKRAIAELARRQPCVPFLQEALAGGGIPADKAPARPSSCSDVFWDDQEAMPGSPPDLDYHQRLASAASPADWQGLLRAAAVRIGPKWRTGFSRVRFGQGDGAAALHRIADRSHLSLGEVVRDASRGLDADELGDLYFIAALAPRTTEQLTALAPAELASAKSYPPAEKAFWQQVLGATAYSNPQAYAEVASKLEALFKAKDSAALKAFEKDPSKMVTQRMLAGSYLLHLGDEAGFTPFDELASLPPEDLSAVLETLTDLRDKTTPAIQQRLDKLLAGFPSREELRARKQALMKSVSVH